MTKTLNNWFDSWIKVRLNNSLIPLNYSVEILWCKANIGLMNKNWRHYCDESDLVNQNTYPWMFCFKYEKDAMLFILVHGGEIV